MTVQRYDTMANRSAGGLFVLYTDHVAALAEAVLRGMMNSHRGRTTYAAGRAEALREARDAVAALPWEVAISFGPIDCDYSCEIGPCTCSGVMRPEGWTTGPGDVLAAIDALGADHAT
jgi:hypothetical protein